MAIDSRYTLRARTCTRLKSHLYLIPKRNIANISPSAKFSQRNKGINLITYKLNRVNLIVNAKEKENTRTFRAFRKLSIWP